MPKLDFKKGFTLFELMLVIVIVGVVYSLMIQNFAFSKEESEGISLENLPEYLRKNFSSSKEKITFRCMDECSICSVFVGSQETNQTEGFFEKYTDPSVYTLIDDTLKRVEFADYVKDYKHIRVCFEYHLYANGSSDKLVVKYKDSVYMYDNFFEKTKKFRSLLDAQDFWVSQLDEAKGD